MKIIIAPIVEEQIRDQALYIAKDSIDKALAWETRLRKEINAIGEIPGHAIDEELSKQIGHPIRKKVFERMYLIHYRIIDATVVEILNFRHGMRKPLGE
jgi:plasmid stabilization system protein ParE